jgi:hypothetical protein
VAGGLGMLSGRLCGPRCSLRSVNPSDNVHLTGLDVIDDSIGAFQNFPYLCEIDFGNDAAGSGEGAGLLGASGDKTNVPRVS